jgi:GR25 family glycosyltransferase involved in LPS biosynthesis
LIVRQQRLDNRILQYQTTSFEIAESGIKTMDIYIINLDKDLHRWHRISNHMKALGMPYSRWSATDGNNIDSSKFDNEPLEVGIFIRDFREWSRNEAACGISHIRLLHHLVRC